MNTMYFLSGPPRAAKSTIMNNLVARTGVQLVAADALEHGLRNVLIGEPHQMLRQIDLNGSAEYKKSFTEGGDSRPFTSSGTEAEFILKFVIGMMDYYRRNNESAAFEGTDLSPAWVSQINIPGLIIKPAYVGYTDVQHAETILNYAKANTHDWINDWLRDDNGDETKIRDWITGQTEVCKKLKLEAESHSYPYFDISTQPFETYKASVLNYFVS